MDIKPFLGSPKPLSKWVDACVNHPGQQYWLIFEDSKVNEEITLSIEMYPITGDTGDLSDEEYEEFDESIIRSGYCNFLNLDQLEDIISNLRMQKPEYAESELQSAITHYFKRDAFITI